MAGLGVHFAISEETVSRLLAAEDDADVISIVEQIEAELEPAFVFPTDEAWDALHRCLTNGTLKRDSGVFPLSHVVLGGVQLCEDQGYLVSLVRADQVSAVADALTPLDQSWLRARYDGSEFPGYGRRRGEEDFSYTWRHVKGIGNFFQSAADDGRAVIFTVEL